MNLRTTMAVVLLATMSLDSFCPAQTITAVEDKAGVTVTIPGALKVLINKERGLGARIYDLRSAPDYNLSSAYNGHGLLWASVSPTEPPKTMSDQYYFNPVDKVELLESGSTRVAVRLSGVPAAWGRNARLKGARFEQVFTMYPDGNINGESALIVGDEPVSLHYLAAGLITTGYWGPQGLDQVHAVAGDTESQRRTGAKPVPSVLQWSNGPDYFTDVLLAFHEGEYNVGNLWGSNESRLFQFFTAVDMTKLLPENPIPAGTRTSFRFLIRLADDMNGPKHAAPYINDYRSPDKLAVTAGKLVDSDEGDYDKDGFNEREGCYVLMAEGKGVDFTIHGSSVPRMDPAFKVKDWKGAAPDAIFVDGMKLEAGKDFGASVKDGVLLLQILGFIDTDSRIVIGGRIPAMGAAGGERKVSDAPQKMILAAVEKLTAGKSSEEKSGPYRSGCRAEIVKEPDIAGGAAALKIEIRDDMFKVGAKGIAPEAGAWDGYDYLTFDVYNPQKDMNDLMFSLRGPGVKNKNGLWLKEMLLRPGVNHVELQLKGASADWKQALTEWEAGQFEMSTSIGTTLYLTGFRLEKGGIRKTAVKGVHLIRIEADKRWPGQ
ncbi:MAG: hypothetical protein ACE15C_16030 [Phycisphaerae bacterium]